MMDSDGDGDGVCRSPVATIQPMNVRNAGDMHDWRVERARRGQRSADSRTDLARPLPFIRIISARNDCRPSPSRTSVSGPVRSAYPRGPSMPQSHVAARSTGDSATSSSGITLAHGPHQRAHVHRAKHNAHAGAGISSQEINLHAIRLHTKAPRAASWTRLL